MDDALRRPQRRRLRGLCARAIARYSKRPPRRTSRSMARTSRRRTSRRRVDRYGQMELPAGSHFVSDGYPDPNLVVALVSVDDAQSLAGSHRRARASAAAESRDDEFGLRRAKTSRNGAILGEISRSAQAPSARSAPTVSCASALPFAVRRIAARSPRTSRTRCRTFSAAGVIGTSALMMPPQWYREDPDRLSSGSAATRPRGSSLRAMRTCASSLPGTAPFARASRCG